MASFLWWPGSGKVMGESPRRLWGLGFETGKGQQQPESPVLCAREAVPPQVRLGIIDYSSGLGHLMLFFSAPYLLPK